MATFIDEREQEVELQEDEQYEALEQEEEEQTQQEQPAEEGDEAEEEIPEKYKGKTIADIVRMHQEAEKLVGRQGQEVGELRKIVDDFIASQTVKKEEQAQSVLDSIQETDFFENPKETIQKILDNHPSVQQSQQIALELKKQEIIAKLKATHPDFVTTIQNPEFAEWIQKSKVRVRLLQEADKNYDFDAADELLTLWKERQTTVNQTVELEKKQRQEQVKTASTGTSKGSGEKPARKIYRRADIIDLMRKDPQRYEALMPEIRQAYAEGRVK